MQRGRPRWSAVLGEPGIGKTRLVETAVERARVAGAATVSTRAYAVERRIAYGPIVDALRSILADPVQGSASARSTAERWRALPPSCPAWMRRRMSRRRPVRWRRRGSLAAIATGLEAALGGERPGLFVVDDLHWADDATLGALAYLVRRLEGHRMAVVMTWRTEELDDMARPVAALATGIAGDAVVVLERLAFEDVAALIAPCRHPPTGRRRRPTSCGGRRRAAAVHRGGAGRRPDDTRQHAGRASAPSSRSGWPRSTASRRRS